MCQTNVRKRLFVARWYCHEVRIVQIAHDCLQVVGFHIIFSIGQKLTIPKVFSPNKIFNQ